MKKILVLVVSLFLPFGAAFATATAGNEIVINPYTLYTPPAGGSLFSAPSTTVPDGTYYDPADPLTIVLDLSAPVTLGSGIDFLFGLSSTDTTFNPGDPMFDVSFSLYDAGTLEAAPFGFAETNVFPFPIDNIYTYTFTTLTAPDLSAISSVTFDQVILTVSGPDPVIGSFSTDVANPPGPAPKTPDASTTLALLALGLGSLAFAGRRTFSRAG